MAPLSSPVLKRLHSLDTPLSKSHGQLNRLLHEKEYQECVSNLRGDDLIWLVDYLDEAIPGLDPSSPASQKCLHELRAICGAKAILPKSYDLSPDLLNIHSSPVASGGCYVYEGTYRGSKVCVKRVRMDTSPQMTTKPFYKEAAIWKHLKHQNILPFLGVTTNPLQLTSEWMPGGTLLEYIKTNPDVDRLLLLSDVASGLLYLHSRDVIHGDLKGSSVVVDADGYPRIADFRFATVGSDVDFEQTTPGEDAGSRKWPAPEILEDRVARKEADIFSFAMVMIETFTATTPGTLPVMTVVKISKGERPSRPAHVGVTGGLWKLIRRCWDSDPNLRPKASELVRALLTLNPPLWKRLISPTLPRNERVRLMMTIFSDRDEVEVFQYLSGNDAQAFVDMIHETLESSGGLSEIRSACLRSSYKICRREALLPKSLQIPLCYDLTENATCFGGLADVWKGKHKGQVVAAKALRVYQTSDLEGTRKWFCKEVVLWKTLDHQNVLPLLGVTMTENPHRFVMVTKWLENGNISAFLKKHPDANRLKLLADATKGLIYLHDQGVIHGDLKGANIMIHDDGRAMLADFSLITLIPDQSTFLSTCLAGGTVHWMSPELIDPTRVKSEKSRPTKESDCYALGMVVYEVLSGCVPFGTNISFAVIPKVLNGEQPKKPEGEEWKLFTQGIWDVVKRCWDAVPSERASAQDVLLCLEKKPS